jgi:rod shape-determining protein MreD
VYAALQRNSLRAILFGTFSGLAVDALSGGLLGANGFSKTLVAYIVSEIARRVYMDNLLLRIPVIAGACFLDDALYYGLHRLLGQAPTGQFLIVASYTLFATTIVGTAVYVFLDSFMSERLASRKREVFSTRRQSRRRNPIRLGK